MSTDAALLMLRAGDPAGALHRLRIPAADPSAESGRYAALGMVLLAGRRPGEALTALRRAIALGDTDPVTALNLALALDGIGQGETARQAMAALAARYPDWDEPCLRLAESLRAAGQHTGAQAAYRRALDANPLRAEALIGLAALLIGCGDGAGAQTLLLRCCGVSPDQAEAWDALGLALELTDDYGAAVTAFAEAQRLAPDSSTMRCIWSRRRARPALRRRNWHGWNSPPRRRRWTCRCWSRSACCASGWPTTRAR